MADANVFELIKVLYKGMHYYAKLEVLTDRINLISEDLEIDSKCFFQSNFTSVQPIVDQVKKVFRLRFNFVNLRKSPLILVVKDIDVLKRLESAVNEFFGASTDYHPNEIVMEEANEH